MKDISNDIELDIPTLGHYLARALRGMIKQLNKELQLQDIDLHSSDFIIMKVLSVKVGLTQSELAKILGKEKSGISHSLTSLEKKGYISRKAVNGCTNNVFLTEEGKEIILVINKMVEKITDKALTGFTEKKRKELMDNLSKVYKNTL